MIEEYRIWFKAVRAQLFITSIVSVMLGTSLAMFETGQFEFDYFLLVMLCVVFCHAGTNLFNDYYDHLSKNDDINDNRSLFNGGSGCIQERLISAETIKRVGIILYLIALLGGLSLATVCGYVAVIYVLVGLLSGYLYSGFPHLSYKGAGEVLVALNFGPLVVTGSYFVQTGFVSMMSIIVSLPMGLLIAAVLYINQFPDFECDHRCHKRNWVVRLGIKSALPYYYVLLILAYTLIIFGVIFGLLPFTSTAALFTLPCALIAALIARKWYANPCKIVGASALTVLTHASVGLLLTGVFAWEMLM